MHESESEVIQSCPTLSDPMDCSPPGSSVHGIVQARVLEWGAIAFSHQLLYMDSFSWASPGMGGSGGDFSASILHMKKLRFREDDWFQVTQ